MMFRSIAAVLAGIVIWFGLFMLLGICCGLVWPDYRLAAQQYFESQDFGLFTVSMMLANLTFFAITGTVSGWLVTLLGASRKPALILAGLGLVYGLFDHYYLEWNVLPTWYNLAVPWILAGSIYFGARLRPLSKAASTS